LEGLRALSEAQEIVTSCTTAEDIRAQLELWDQIEDQVAALHTSAHAAMEKAMDLEGVCCVRVQKRLQAYADRFGLVEGETYAEIIGPWSLTVRPISEPEEASEEMGITTHLVHYERV